MTQDDSRFVIGVDVGTGSARAGVFDLRGRMLTMAVHPIRIFRPQTDYVEQSSQDIWQAVCRATRAAIGESKIAPASVKGISFDATCSLVALDEGDAPVSLSPKGATSSADDEMVHNVIVWMDHRATAETDEINRTGHRVLDYVGGKMSPEQEPPKLKWIKEHLPDSWQRTAKFFDLADYLVYEACKNDVRSLCTVVCKWTYMGHEGAEGSWDQSFFDRINLSDLFAPNRAGARVRPMGTPAGKLTAGAANDLGLTEGAMVGVGIIDAHAGGVGSLGMMLDTETPDAARLERTLALVGGTSSCHMAVSPEARFISGVWGPYFGAMIPGMWLTEGGQSATGALLDHVIENHAFTPRLKETAREKGATIYELLNAQVAKLRAEAADINDLTYDLHVEPDFHGNRSPRADAHARGMISGLALDSSFDSLARIYLATIQAIAYGTRHIIETLNAHGYQINRIHACGGGTRNPLWLQEHADITGCAVLVARDCETVLLGAGMLAAVACGAYDSIVAAMSAMSPRAELIAPRQTQSDFHRRKYAVFQTMYADQQRYRELMNA